MLTFIQKAEFEDTKVVVRMRNSKDRQHNGLELEDTKVVIRMHNSKDRQHNDQKKKDKSTKHYRET